MRTRALRCGLLLALATAACALPTRSDEPAWQPLWSPTSPPAAVVFGGDGELRVDGDTLSLGIGSPLSGATFAAALPASDYEVEWTSTRVLGNDFFCGFTFPVPGGHLTLILGGWGGTVCGLSCLDGEDAAHNDTRRLRAFATGRPYRVHLAVRGRAVDVAIDGEPFLHAGLAHRRCTVRAEVDLCRPLGIACYATAARFCGMRWRLLQ